MATFIFVHGSFHAAWNWHKVMPIVEQRGHASVALDLPGHGLDRTPARRVTLAACVDRVLEIVEAQRGDVILVAHSRNGMVISQAAEQRPELLQGLVYLAAYLVPHGRSMMDYAVLDGDSLVLRNVEPRFSRRRAERLLPIARSAAARWLLAWLLPGRMQAHALAPPCIREALYHDCPDEVTELARTLLQPEPNWPGFTPLRLGARYRGVPKVYIQCTEDRAVTPALQRRMLADTPCDRVFTLDTGHSPFFSRPAALVDLLVESLATFSQRHGATLPPSAGLERSA